MKRAGLPGYDTLSQDMPRGQRPRQGQQASHIFPTIPR